MKRLLQLIIYIQLFIITLFAQVQINAPSSFTQNELYYFTIEASGENIIFPKIEKVQDFIVQEAGQSRSISNINGVVSSKYIKRYQLYANKDFVLPSFEVNINGEIFKTQSVAVKKTKREKTTSQYFEFNIISSKKELYVGESTLVTLQFKHRRDVKIMDYNLNLSSFENFWHKSLEKNRQFREGDFIVQELDFLLFPQKSGTISIEPINIDVVVLDTSNAYGFFGNNTKKIKVFSNELNVNVKSLPTEISLVGDFDIDATIDKTSINQGETLNYKVMVNGVGNIDDIKDIQLDIPNTTVYENKAIVNASIKDNKYKGSYIKSFSLLPTQNITIPSIKLAYFDLKTQSIKQVYTKAYDVEVLSQTSVSKNIKLEKASVPKIVKKEVVVETTNTQKLMFFILGSLMTLLSIGLYFYVINNKKKKQSQSSLEQLIKKAKDKEQIIYCLLPYVDMNEEIKAFVFKLEKDDNSQLKIYKKELLGLIKKYKIKG